MKKILLAGLLCLLAFASYGQELVVNEIDEFTGNPRKETKWLLFNRHWNEAFYFRIRQLDTSYIIDMRVACNPEGCKIKFIKEGDILFLKTYGNTILQLPATMSVTQSMGGGSIALASSQAYGYVVPFAITKKQLLKIKHEDAQKFRLHSSTGDLEYDFNDKCIRYLYEAINLILPE